MGQSAQCEGERELCVVGDRAAILVEELDGVAHMLRRLRVKLHGRRMMFCHVGGTYACAGRWRHRRRIGAVRASVVCLIDRMQGVAMGHHRLMRGVGKISTVLEMPRRLAVMARGLLVV
ncbi:hypothetical protein FVF58_08030 [Paraburkholderia panacisoli]|uniref:Uncharacterized protein n=1 Tax=Paraburkholderia panacisoli TaxID=2603818 RepID=A0A5B0HF52_9BURK|nr:hypothetical protein FVF58_08030 [Paraburkholderia panacisoli]